jgi:ribosomal protein L12E/L44/L45/RPP1/RPP2
MTASTVKTELTYQGLRRAVMALSKDITRATSAIRVEAGRMSDEAKDTARIAQMISSMGVDADTVADATTLSKIMEGVSAEAISYISTSEMTARAASAAHDQARATHQGIQEAVTRSPVDVSSTSREWFRQE